MYFRVNKTSNWIDSYIKKKTPHTKSIELHSIVLLIISSPRRQIGQFSINWNASIIYLFILAFNSVQMYHMNYDRTKEAKSERDFFFCHRNNCSYVHVFVLLLLFLLLLPLLLFYSISRVVFFSLVCSLLIWLIDKMMAEGKFRLHWNVYRRIIIVQLCQSLI